MSGFDRLYGYLAEKVTIPPSDGDDIEMEIRASIPDDSLGAT